MKSYRQGDVLVVEVKAIPKGAQDVTGDSDIVLMHGELTGHAHRIKEPQDKVRLLDVQAERYLRVLQEATIRHEEHAPIVLREGRYKQAFQVEDFGDEVRRVAD